MRDKVLLQLHAHAHVYIYIVRQHWEERETLVFTVVPGVRSPYLPRFYEVLGLENGGVAILTAAGGGVAWNSTRAAAFRSKHGPKNAGQ